MIPRDAKCCKFCFQTLAKSPVVSRIVGGDTKQFVGNPVVSQDFQDNAGHILAGVVITETFEAHDFLMRLKIVVDPLHDDPYKSAE
jgi:hypothetical protein